MIVAYGPNVRINLIHISMDLSGYKRQRDTGMGSFKFMTSSIKDLSALGRWCTAEYSQGTLVLRTRLSGC